MKNIIIIVLLLNVWLYACHGGQDREELIITDADTLVSSSGIIWRNYLSSSLQLLKDSVWSDQKGRSFFVQSPRLYISPGINRNVYVGAIVTRKFNAFPCVDVQGSMDNEAISLSFSFGSGKQYHYSQIPSKESMDSLIRAYLKDNKVQQFTSIIYNSGIKYSSYKELYLQFSYLGIRLDSLLRGNKYNFVSMDRKNGIAIILERSLFSLDMDMPLIRPINIFESDKNDLAYISSIMFGDIKIMLLESDLSMDEMSSFVELVKNGNILNCKECEIINDFDVFIVDFNSRQIKKRMGKYDLIYSFYNEVFEIDGSITPLYALFSNYYDHNPFDISFYIHLP